jgi:hypothetical protein
MSAWCGGKIPTKQEMFDMAVVGLANQKWERSTGLLQICVYLSKDGKRCAWGHVDKMLTEEHNRYTSIENLASIHVKYENNKPTLAYYLDESEILFVEEMQAAHDFSSADYLMKEKFIELGNKYGLTWPEEVGKYD